MRKESDLIRPDSSLVTDPHSGDLWGQVVSESGVCICGDPVGTGPRGFDQLACDQKTTRRKLARDQKTLIEPVVS